MKEGTKSFVLDAEAVAIDRQTGKLMPFQELSKRKRKDVKVEDIQVRVCLFGFDLLYLNGEVSPYTDVMVFLHINEKTDHRTFLVASTTQTISGTARTPPEALPVCSGRI